MAAGNWNGGLVNSWRNFIGLTVVRIGLWAMSDAGLAEYERRIVEALAPAQRRG